MEVFVFDFQKQVFYFQTEVFDFDFQKQVFDFQMEAVEVKMEVLNVKMEAPSGNQPGIFADLSGACTGRPNYQYMAYSRGFVFGVAMANQDHRELLLRLLLLLAAVYMTVPLLKIMSSP